jgi:hypothetical protein
MMIQAESRFEDRLLTELKQVVAARSATDSGGACAPRPVAWVNRRKLALAGAAVSVALATAVVFVLASGTDRPSRSVSQAPGQPSGQQILLAAATVAEAKPPGTGLYWHVKQSHHFPSSTGGKSTFTQETWIAHDGTFYSFPTPDATTVDASPSYFKVGRLELTYEQLQLLPTDPVALTARIESSTDAPDDLPGWVADGLTDLLWWVPAPPGVRAASFRALASMPNVTNLGTMDGGQALGISITPPPADKFPNGKVPAGADSITVAIDPATSKLLSLTTYQGTTKILVAEWTNELPEVAEPYHGG